ncbi:TetR/AcrR family transcriptional regulator [Agromyces protaetiae]|uniref:TetR/AcrR family transcriptional regulator n=1 Tax=Agromyces protaetiae TaxID=2509455 RepID=A0A4P6FAJ4_9MICO|nr:TetR/AcrR family transcriptional regulator [Agromyces protaetiae]QAY72824.1 TetR/AcrR family transcriptional regulator [Agromyces protaetiae]
MQTSAGAGRRPRRDAAANRESLIRAAALCLAESPDASLEQIAAAAGLTRRAVYGHFANRDELVFALIERGTERLNRAAEPSATEISAPVAIALLGARLWSVVGHVRLLASMALTQPYVERVTIALAPVREHLGAVVALGIADGTLRGDLRPELLERLVEGSAIAVLLESARTGMPDAEGRRVAMLSMLATAGLSWREAGDLIDATPALRARENDPGDPGPYDLPFDAPFSGARTDTDQTDNGAGPESSPIGVLS